MEQSAQRQQVQRGQPVSEEKHCSHCGTRHTSSSWRRHPPSGQQLCDACGKYADEHRGQLPPDSLLQRRPAQPRQMEDVRSDMAQRLCLHCGSASPGGKGAFWRRHPATGEEWVCTPCHGRAYYQLKKVQSGISADRGVPRQAGRTEAPQQGKTQRRGGEGERPAMVTQPGSQAGPAAAARKRAQGQQQQSRQQQPAAGAASGGAASDPAAKRRRKKARPLRQPPPQVQPAMQLAGPAALADATDHDAEADGAAAAAVAPAARAGPAGAVPGGRVLVARSGAESRAAALAAAAGVVGQLGQAVPATGQVEQQQDAAEPDLYSLLQEAAEQAAAAASGLTAELAAAVAAALPLDPKKVSCAGFTGLRAVMDRIGSKMMRDDAKC